MPYVEPRQGLAPRYWAPGLRFPAGGKGRSAMGKLRSSRDKAVLGALAREEPHFE
jgi:hypothetical protein